MKTRVDRRTRRMGITWCLAALVAAVVCAGAGGALAQRPGPPGPGHGPPVEHMVDRWADELGLDAEARSRLEALAESGRAEQDRLREQLRGEQEALRGLLMVPTPDEAAVMRQADTIGALETRAQKARLRTLLAVRASLTPEQRERLSALHAERRARFEQTLQEGCGEEIAQHCADAPAGPGRMLCLREHRDALSATCSDALRSLRHEWRRGRGEGRRGGRGPGSERGGPPPPR